MMDSDKHYEGNHLYIWQLCMLLWHPWSSQNSVILQLSIIASDNQYGVNSLDSFVCNFGILDNR